MKSILITGVAGFIGSNLLPALISNHNIIGVDNLDSGSLENIDQFINNDRFQFIEGDLADTNFVKSLPRTEIIINMAAKVGVQRTYNETNTLIFNNLNITENISEKAKVDNSWLISASSSEVYGNQDSLKVSENDDSRFEDITNPRMSYSLTKALDEIIIKEKLKDTSNYTLLRMFNVIGNNQSAKYGMVVPKFINQALNNESLTVYGDGTQKRTFVDVRDISKAIELIINQKEACKNTEFNLGGMETVSILELANRIKKLTASGSKINFIDYKKVSEDYKEIYYRKPDISKVKTNLDWEPSFLLDDTLNFMLKRTSKKRYA